MPSIDNAYMLAVALGVRPAWLAFGELGAEQGSGKNIGALSGAKPADEFAPPKPERRRKRA
jgi:hypothetical protein